MKSGEKSNLDGESRSQAAIGIVTEYTAWLLVVVLLFVNNIVYRRCNLQYCDKMTRLVPHGNLSHSLRSSEITPLDLSRNIVVEFRPITVVVVVSLTVDSRFRYGFDGWHNLRLITRKLRIIVGESNLNYKITKSPKLRGRAKSNDRKSKRSIKSSFCKANLFQTYPNLTASFTLRLRHCVKIVQLLFLTHYDACIHVCIERFVLTQGTRARETSTLCSPFLNEGTNCYNTSGGCQDFARCSIVRNDASPYSAPRY